ncbi:hypothetical protein [Streptomyces asiaticus]|uniref:hypothetical protein n=1 Tax=Streptomyces asiaticus TaxID=114695 RepID=UPI003D71CD03
MTVSLPLVLVLGAVAWIAIKFMGVRLWVVVVVALFGFWLAHTGIAPSVESRTRSGVDSVNRQHD